MATKKTGTSKVHRDVQKGGFVAVRPRKPYTPPDIKREAHRQIPLSVKNPKADLRNAISEAARHDAQTSKFRTIKEAKRGRRDVIVKTIMRHTRESHQ